MREHQETGARGKEECDGEEATPGKGVPWTGQVTVSLLGNP